MTQARVPRPGDGRDRGSRGRTTAKAAHRATSPSTDVAGELLALQRSVGNRVAVVRAGQLQAKLLVGAAYDPAERQADEVAHQVMRQLREGSASAEVGDLEAEQPALQRLVDIRRVVEAPIGLDGGEVSEQLAGTIQAERGRGHGLPAPVLRPFEQAFGADLSHVRVHHDQRSSELSQAVSAKAFTIGSDIFLGASQYRPETSSGQELLAHEVTHTIQQGW